jgi:hypothetical protein
MTSLSYIHTRLGQSGPYQEPCVECCRLFSLNRETMGCQHHHGHRQVFRKGNPRVDFDMGNIMKAYQKQHREWVPQGDSPLTPMELFKIRGHLFSALKGDGMFSFQLWTQLLLGATHFLRSELELCNIQIESFIPSMTKKSSDGTVLSLAIKIWGKTDKKWHVQIIWRNDAIPELCPLRHILAWVAISGIESGYIFRGDFEVDKPMPYRNFNLRYQICI